MNRREAEELLPWFVAGSLDADERRAVQAFVDSGEISAQQLNEINLFADTIAEQAAHEPAYNPKLLDNVMAQLDQVEQFDPAEAAPIVLGESHQPRTGLIQRVTDWLQLDGTPSWAKLAIGAQFGLVLALGAVVLSQPSTPGVDEPASHVVVAGPTVTGDVAVAFAPGVSETQVRELLDVHGAQIVAGPNTLGMYTLDIVDADAAAVTAAINTMQADPRTIFAQPTAK